jgi:hypothetical protein
MTTTRPTTRRAALWLPGLAVAAGAAAATAHGLFEVALASAVPAGIAWLYPLITDGLALVAYTATASLSGHAARYAWAVVVLAAGLSGLAQATYLASGTTLDASPALRFGIGAWPAVAAAIAAHLLYLLTAEARHDPAASTDTAPSDRSAVHLDTPSDAGSAEHQPGARPAEPSVPVLALSAGPAERPARPAPNAPAKSRARAAALRHASRFGALPTVTVLAETAEVSRGTAAAVLKPLRDQPLPLHLISGTADGQAQLDDQEHAGS